LHFYENLFVFEKLIHYLTYLFYLKQKQNLIYTKLQYNVCLQLKNEIVKRRDLLELAKFKKANRRDLFHQIYLLKDIKELIRSNYQIQFINQKK
jgi:hypothetical protein